VACYQRAAPAPGAAFTRGALNVLTLRDGRIAALNAFLDPGLYGRFGLPEFLATR
jgi:RNA polymerase sigma-70 factor (ECF subfamily)